MSRVGANPIRKRLIEDAETVQNYYLCNMATESALANADKAEMKVGYLSGKKIRILDSLDGYCTC